MVICTNCAATVSAKRFIYRGTCSEGEYMQRRKFITLIGCVAAAGAQQAAMPVVGGVVV